MHRSDEGCGLVCHCGDGKCSRKCGGPADTCIVEGNYPMVSSECVNEIGWPKILATGIAHDQDEWTSRAEASIRYDPLTGLDRLNWSRYD